MPRLVDIAAGNATHSFLLVLSLNVEDVPRAKRARAKHYFPGLKFAARELAGMRADYGPFLSLEQAAKIAGVAPITLKKQRLRR